MKRLLGIALFASLTSCSGINKHNTVSIVAPLYEAKYQTDLRESEINHFNSNDLVHLTTLPSSSLESIEVDTGLSEQRIFISSLAANQEVNINPTVFDMSVNLHASAVGILVIDLTTNTIHGNVTVDSIDADDYITSVTIQSSVAGSNGPVIVELIQNKQDASVFDIPENLSITDSTNAEDGDLSTLLSAGWYFNLKTKRNPSGQLRGQIVPHGMEVLRVELETEQQIPAITKKSAPDVSAVGYFTYSKTDSSVLPTANVYIHGFEAIEVNLHCGGFVGDTGPVQIMLNDISMDEFPGTVFTANHMPVASLDALENGTYYFNAHSVQNPSGEIRGQIITDYSRAMFAHLKSKSSSSVNTNRVKGISKEELKVSAANPLVFPVSNVSVSGFQTNNRHSNEN